MSLTRNFFREFRPLFRVLEDPFLGRAPFAYNGQGRSVFDDPLGVFKVAATAASAESAIKFPYSVHPICSSGSVSVLFVCLTVDR